MRLPEVLKSLSVVVLLIIVGGVRADTVLYDSNGFEAPTFTAGSSPVGQDGWSAAGGSPAAFVVETSKVAGGTQAVQANGTGDNDSSFIFPSIFDAPGPNERVLVQVDMARTLSANPDDSSPVYAVDVYDDGINRTSRFGLQENNDQIRAFISVPINNQGQIDPAGPGIKSEFYGAAVSSDTFVHLDFWLDYTSKTVKLSLDGTPIAVGVPFNTQSSTDIVAAALQIGSLENSNDNGWFDNYAISVVPFLRGDVDNNGIVNGQDIAVLASHWLNTGVAPPGDANEDGIVNGQDIAVIASHWLQTVGGAGSGSGTAVPEPSAFVMLAIAATIALVPGCKRRLWNG